MVARKEPTGWVQGIAISRSLFLRRKVARRWEKRDDVVSGVKDPSQTLIHRTHCAWLGETLFSLNGDQLKEIRS